MRVLLIDISPFMAAVTPISLGGVGAVLKEMGHEVRILSLGSTSRFSPVSLLGSVKEFGPRLVGFGTYQRNLHHVRALAGAVKKTVPDASVVLGGPQATFLPDTALAALPDVDYISRGEGEQAIRALAEAIEGETDGPIAGVTSRAGTGPAPEPPEDLDAYPSPWLTGVLDPAAMEESILLSSRGCSNCCAFCYTPAASGRKIRAHSVERVLEDVAHVAAGGTGRLWFADPNFSFSGERVTAILEGILDRGLKVRMWIETRADMLTPELIALMKRAGVHTVAMGLESASPGVYPALNKGIEPGEIGRAAKEALAAGIDVELFSQYALPNENFKDAMRTLAFVRDCGVKIRGNTNAQQMQIYFGSDICTNVQTFGIRPLRKELPPYLAIGSEFETDWMDREQILRVRDAWREESLDGGKRVVS
ncbi:MAG: B12-binding domain-containing radical SAM protein [Planctomycetota bacterium]|jgi:radical SAM superfamily enzyme YgiQ (UPF0313 family)